MPKHISPLLKWIIGLTIVTILLPFGSSDPSPEAQALQPTLFQSPLHLPTSPQLQEVALPDTTGETVKWSKFTGPKFILRYPSDWQARVLPDQIKGTKIVEFTYSTPDNRVDASIQVWETWLLPGEDWEEDPELKMLREQSAQYKRSLEQVFVGGQPGWLMQTRQPISPGTLVQAVFVAREGRLYRFRLYLYQDKVVGPHMRTFGLMLGTLQTSKGSVKPADTSSSEPLPKVGAAALTGSAAVTANYNRGAAYAYAATWYSQQNNSDGCYLWYNGSVLDCVFNPGDYGVDGAHFVNRAVWTGGRPIPQLLPSFPAEARTVPALRTWLINDGWTAVSASQAQVGDVVIIGNQCWAGLVVQVGDPPIVATHSVERWGSAGPLQCNGNSSKEYLHAPQGAFFSYLPIVIKPPAMKMFSGMHLGNRESGDWTAAMLDPIDGRKTNGIYPRAIIVQSKQVWQINRPTSPPCEVAGAILRAERTRVYNYLTQAVKDGAIIIIRIAPSPGNFDDWDGTGTHTLITTPTPAGGDYCGNKWELFRAIDDIVEEMDAIHDINQINGWPETGYYFIPANEPNLEWYSSGTTPPVSSVTAWQAMDDYFAAVIAHARQFYPELQILTPAMTQAQYAEGVDWGRGGLGNCPLQLVGGTQKGYDIMVDTYTRRSDGYHGYSWNNYFVQGREAYATCVNGGFHMSAEFPSFMQQAMQEGHPAFIQEADLCSWFITGTGNCYNNNPIHNKEDNPALTAASLRSFYAAEWQATKAIPVMWLLNSDQFVPEFNWHEAYNEATNTLYNWFTTWWNGSE